MIESIYNQKTHNINWENVWNIPEFKLLQTTEHSRKWHKEGVVAIHTMMVVNEMDKKVPYENGNEEYRMIMMLSALFHDIGKGETTFFNTEKNDWSATNHAEVGAIITQRLLVDENPFIRETICYFVRNHMKPLYISDSPTGIRDLIKISHDAIFPKYCNFENLLILKTCDCLGSKFDDYDGWREKLEFARSLADELECLKNPYKFSNCISKYEYFNQSIESFPKIAKPEYDFTAYLTIGNVHGFDLDNVNYVIDDGEDDVIDQVIECCEDKATFIMNIEVLEEDAWEMLTNMIYLYGGKVTFVYGSTQKYLTPTLSMEFITRL